MFVRGHYLAETTSFGLVWLDVCDCKQEEEITRCHKCALDYVFTEIISLKVKGIRRFLKNKLIS